MNVAYKELADRNGWNYCELDNRPYFMKDGKYAAPDETTSDEDKELLANIISEGSKEMAQLIQICWDNEIGISGPCSGIREYHDEPPISLHFSFTGKKDIIQPLYHDLQSQYPEFKHLIREDNGSVKYDFDYVLNGKELSTEDSDMIFSVLKAQLQTELDNNEEKKHQQIC